MDKIIQLAKILHDIRCKYKGTDNCSFWYNFDKKVWENQTNPEAVEYVGLAKEMFDRCGDNYDKVNEALCLVFGVDVAQVK